LCGLLPLVTLIPRVIELVTQHLVQLLESRNFGLKSGGNGRCEILLLTEPSS
jgi:hypothetical protein